VSKKNIETAINDYVRSETKGATFQTGWILCVSLAPPSGDNSAVDSYISISSDGLPSHSQLGLLKIAEWDMRNMSLMGVMGQTIGFIVEDDDDGDSGEPF
jgi:hypothetical protein